MTIFNYTVNYVDLAIVGIMLIAFFIGYGKGIIITIVNLIRYAVGLFLCMLVCNEYAQPFYDSYVKDRIVNELSDKVVTSSNIDEIINNLTDSIDSLPSAIRNNFDISTLSISSHDDIANSIAENLFEPVAFVLVKVLLFAVIFIVFFLITGMIIYSVRHHYNNKHKDDKKKSSLKTIDKIFGGIFGLVKGALFIFVLVSLFALLFEFNLFENNAIMNEVNNSTLYNYLLNINPFNIVTEKIL